MKYVSKAPWRALAALVVAGAIIGCEDDSGSAAPSGLDISGHWSGRYVSPGQEESITADVTQDGASVVIGTSKKGPGELLIGVITPDDRLQLVDEYDGETWTSDGEVTANEMVIRDFLPGSNRESGPGEEPEAPAEQDLILRR